MSLISQDSNKYINLILACTFEGGIGYRNNLPWHLPSELKKFKQITSETSDPCKQNAVIMGRRTWQSLKNPLKGRINIVLSKNTTSQVNTSGFEIYRDIQEAIDICNKRPDIENIFVIGGKQIFNSILLQNNLKVEKIILSVVFGEKYKTDTNIDMQSLYTNYDLYPDDRYIEEKSKREFSSYICLPKVKNYS